MLLSITQRTDGRSVNLAHMYGGELMSRKKS